MDLGDGERKDKERREGEIERERETATRDYLKSHILEQCNCYKRLSRLSRKELVAAGRPYQIRTRQTDPYFFPPSFFLLVHWNTSDSNNVDGHSSLVQGKRTEEFAPGLVRPLPSRWQHMCVHGVFEPDSEAYRVQVPCFRSSTIHIGSEIKVPSPHEKSLRHRPTDPSPPASGGIGDNKITAYHLRNLAIQFAVE